MQKLHYYFGPCGDKKKQILVVRDKTAVECSLCRDYIVNIEQYGVEQQRRQIKRYEKRLNELKQSFVCREVDLRNFKRKWGIE